MSELRMPSRCPGGDPLLTAWFTHRLRRPRTGQVPQQAANSGSLFAKRCTGPSAMDTSNRAFDTSIPMTIGRLHRNPPDRNLPA